MKYELPEVGENGWVGFDLDGTLALYTGWNGGAIGPPIPAMLEHTCQRATNAG